MYSLGYSRRVRGSELICVVRLKYTSVLLAVRAQLTKDIRDVKRETQCLSASWKGLWYFLANEQLLYML